jgi:receptor expression-enhancing protein 5/6
MSNQTHPALVNAQNQARYYVGQLDKELSKYPVLNRMEARTQVPKAYTVMGIFALSLLCLFVNALAAPVSNLVGWALPAYLSFKALETQDTSDDTQWLTYWVVFGFLNFLESFASRIILYYLPFYYPMKVAFALWLQLPATKGARTVYHSVLRPVFSSAKARTSSPVAPTAPTSAPSEPLM